MLRVIQRAIVFTIVASLMTLSLGAAAQPESTIPSSLASMTSSQLRAYFAAQSSPVVMLAAKKQPKPIYTADQLIEWGKEELYPTNNTVNPSKALAFFDYALVLQPANQTANFWDAICLLVTDPNITAQLQQMGVIDPTTQAINLKAHTVSVDTIILKQYQSLDADELQDISMALTHFNRVTTAFSDEVTYNNNTVHLDYAAAQSMKLVLSVLDFQARVVNVYNTGNAQITKDVVVDEGMFGPILAFNLVKENTLWNDLLTNGYVNGKGVVQGAFWSLKAYTAMQLSAVFTDQQKQAIYNLIKTTKPSVFADDLQDIINLYPSLLTLQASSAADLRAAKNDLLNMANAYTAMSDYVQQQDNKSGYNYFVSLYQSANPANDLTKSQYLSKKPGIVNDDTAIRQLLTNIKNNLNNPAAFPTVVIPNDPQFGNGAFSQPAINLSAVFTPRNGRVYEQNVSTELDTYHLFTDKYQDPTLGGIFPKGTAADLNYAFRLNKQDIGYAYLQGTSSSPTGINLYLQQINSSAVSRQELYRSTTPTVNNKSPKIVTLSQNRPNLYLDSSINPSVNTYYYRLYTYYLFSDGRTATTYGKVFQVIVHPPVANHPPVLMDINTQTVIQGQALKFNVTAVDADSDPVVLTASLSDGSAITNLGAAKFSYTTKGTTTTGVFTWNPAKYIGNGSVSVIFTAADGHGGTDSTIANINVYLKRSI